MSGGLRCAHVGPHRNVHADIAGKAGQYRADEESHADQGPEQQPCGEKDDDADDRDRAILAIEVSLRAFADGSGNLLHARRSGVCVHH